MSGTLGLLFGLTARVSRKTYLVAGVLLMALKYGLDALVVYLGTGAFLDPLTFISPLYGPRQDALQSAESSAIALIVIALPFLWIGVSMSLRRLVDANLSPWLVFLFLVPGLNFALMLMLSIVPSAEPSRVKWYAETPKPTNVAILESAMLGSAIGLAIGVVMILPVSLSFSGYGALLFFVTPFVMGAVSAFIHNRRHTRTIGNTIVVGFTTIVLACGALLLFAFEGAVCLVMAFPLAGGAGIIGALIGRAIAVRGAGPTSHVAMMVLSLPFLAAAETSFPHAALREVETVVEIDAPPEDVWPNVVGFSELPAPNRAIFALGIAYPMRARIEGAGVGAVRHCEFSTGAFVEPITRWEPPRRLSFDVASQPPPMQEWSPYKDVHPPHLDGYLVSRRGEFRLVPLDGGRRTRLEGSTWYTLELFPASYWTVWSDGLIHAIHGRVLAHIKDLSER